eukprot:COSAG05_NODE_419_length_10002_cov_97.065031_6_plen_112_part_00
MLGGPCRPADQRATSEWMDGNSSWGRAGARAVWAPALEIGWGGELLVMMYANRSLWVCGFDPSRGVSIMVNIGAATSLYTLYGTFEAFEGQKCYVQRVKSVMQYTRSSTSL